jgi:hypothetical protein
MACAPALRLRTDVANVRDAVGELPPEDPPLVVPAAYRYAPAEGAIGTAPGARIARMSIERAKSGEDTFRQRRTAWIGHEAPEDVGSVAGVPDRHVGPDVDWERPD